MMNLKTVLTCLILCITEALCSDNWVTIELHHALDSNNPDFFSYRGNISIPSLNSVLPNTLQDPLSKEQRQHLKIFAERNDFYRLKAVVTYDRNTPSQTFTTATTACSLLRSQLNDVLWISTDCNGFITGITITATSPDKTKCENVQTLDEEDFNTEIIVRRCEIAPYPDTASFIQKIEREREARERGDVRDNRGFFAKYWMYIVPVVLLVLISSASSPDAQK